MLISTIETWLAKVTNFYSRFGDYVSQNMMNEQ
jgi:hypothetical protein